MVGSILHFLEASRKEKIAINNMHVRNKSNIMIYRFRVILDNDTEDDIFRDIEIRSTDTLEDLT